MGIISWARCVYRTGGGRISHITVPMGVITLAVGLSLVGTAWSEPKLNRLRVLLRTSHPRPPAPSLHTFSPLAGAQQSTFVSGRWDAARGNAGPATRRFRGLYASNQLFLFCERDWIVMTQFHCVGAFTSVRALSGMIL